MDSYLKTRVANGEIAAYATRLGVRKKWALIGILASVVLAVVSFAFLFGTAWTPKDRAMTRLNTLLVIIVFVIPYVGLVKQAIEYRRLNDMLAFLDVLERVARKDTLEGRGK